MLNLRLLRLVGTEQAELPGDATPPDAPLPESCMASPPEEERECWRSETQHDGIAHVWIAWIAWIVWLSIFILNSSQLIALSCELQP
jgi:hypothetical protein